MRKLLVLILIALLALALTGTACAAVVNPSFGDVPAKHWAYASVTKLAQAGLVDGYGDGTFRGDKPMNRYEFATLVARLVDKYDKADAKQQQEIDKLSAEFASELNKMGARITKVETKTNSWVVGGDTRFRYITDNQQNPGANKLHGSDTTDYRVRIKINGQINENTLLQARLATNYGNKFGNTDGTYGSYANFDIGNVTFKNALGMDAIRIGRTPLDVIGSGIIGKPLNADGVTLYDTWGALKFTGWTGNLKTDAAATANYGTGDSGTAYGLTTAQVTFRASPDAKFGLGYYWANMPGYGLAGVGPAPGFTASLLGDKGSFDNSTGYDFSVNFNIPGMGLHFLGDYVGSSLKNKVVNMPSSSPRAWAFQISNGDGPGATVAYYQNFYQLLKLNDVGKTAFSIGYRSIDPGALPANSGGFDSTAVAYLQNYTVFTHSSDNQNAWYFVLQNCIDKNVLVSFEYQDIRVKNLGMFNSPTFPKNLDKTYMFKVECFF
jgi:hypothetical protein